MKKRRGYDEDLKDIPSMSMSEEDVEDYRFAYQDHQPEPKPTNTLSLWIMLMVVLGLVLVGGYFIVDLRYQLNSSQQQLQMTTTQIGDLATIDKKVSNTGNALQDQLKLLKSDVKKIQEQLNKVQQESQKSLDEHMKAVVAADKKITEITAKLDEHKSALVAVQEALKKNQPTAVESVQQAAQLKALEAKLNELSLDVMAGQERTGSTTTTDSQKLIQIEEQLKSIDVYRKNMNDSMNKMQNDINRLYIDVDALR